MKERKKERKKAQLCRKESSTSANRVDSVRESFSAVMAEILGKKRKPIGEEFGRYSELGRLVTSKERIWGFGFNR